MDGTVTTTEDPYALFQDWMAEATKGEINDPNAVCLATATPDGRPSARMVLLKGVDARGFVFYTNLESRKGGELASNPFAALCFHWKTLQRSIRVEGAVEAVSEAEADAYYASRARTSRLRGLGVKQSRPLESRFALEKAVAEYGLKYAVGISRARPSGPAFAYCQRGLNSGVICPSACMNAGYFTAMAQPGGLRRFIRDTSGRHSLRPGGGGRLSGRACRRRTD